MKQERGKCLFHWRCRMVGRVGGENTVCKRKNNKVCTRYSDLKTKKGAESF